MKILPAIPIPTPFGGSIELPAIETPPLELPAKPDERTIKVIGHGIGEDLADVIGIIPWIGDLAGTLLEDLHHAEILKILTPDEYKKFTEYNKLLPASIALARTLLFRKV